MIMLAPRSMTNAKYNLWGLGTPFTNQVTDELVYDEFSRTCLMPFLTVLVFVLAPFIFFNQSLFAFLYISNIQMKHLCQEGPIVSFLIDPSCLPWSIYSYSPNGFAREHPVSHNTNVTSYPFPKGTQTMSSPSSLFSFLSTLASQHLF